jgi:hypothetical protein
MTRNPGRSSKSAITSGAARLTVPMDHDRGYPRSSDDMYGSAADAIDTGTAQMS